MSLRAALVVVLGLSVPLTGGQAQQIPRRRDAAPAMEAACGNRLPAGSDADGGLEVLEYRSRFYPTLQFYAGKVTGSEYWGVCGLAVRLPGGEVVPLGGAPMRRFIAKYASVDTGDVAALGDYAAEMLKIDGEVSPDARLITDASELPDEARRKAAALGLTPRTPVVEAVGGPSHALRVEIWLLDNRILIRAMVGVSERRRDEVLLVEPVMGY